MASYHSPYLFCHVVQIVCKLIVCLHCVIQLIVDPTDSGKWPVIVAHGQLFDLQFVLCFMIVT